MKNWAFAMFLVVPFLNVLLNTLTARAAKESTSIWNALASTNFLLTIIVGTASVTSLVVLYRSGIALPRGILMMGAASILGGSIWGMYYSGVRFTGMEWALYAAIAAFMGARLYQLIRT